MGPTIEDESRRFEAELRGIAHLTGYEQQLALQRVSDVLEGVGVAQPEIDGVLRRLVRPDAHIELEVGREVTELRVILPEDMS